MRKNSLNKLRLYAFFKMHSSNYLTDCMTYVTLLFQNMSWLFCNPTTRQGLALVACKAGNVNWFHRIHLLLDRMVAPTERYHRKEVRPSTLDRRNTDTLNRSRYWFSIHRYPISLRCSETTSRQRGFSHCSYTNPWTFVHHLPWHEVSETDLPITYLVLCMLYS